VLDFEKFLMSKPFAIIVDIDETICTQFDVPIEVAVEVLQRIDERKLHVHYVTARPEVCGTATANFITADRLPGALNVWMCPDVLDSLAHKRKQHDLLKEKFEVIASIGDSAEEEEASAAAGIPFVAVDLYDPRPAWTTLAARIVEVGGFRDA